MNKSLSKLLCQVKDKRRSQGTRHKVSDIIKIVIMGTISGYHGYRSIGDFCDRYRVQIEQALGLPKHGLASYSSIRRVIMQVDFEELSDLLYQWIRSKVVIEPKEWLQIDGKGIKGSITNYHSSYQNFVSLVSLFMNRTGMILKTKHMYNKQVSEIKVVQELIAQLEQDSVVLSLDAVHCQKKR